VPELRGQLRDRDALGDLDGRVAVPQVVRVEMRDPRRIGRVCRRSEAALGLDPLGGKLETLAT
jgi:hypothetical protein